MIARVAVAAIALFSSATAHATDWVERPYDPPVGSRWIVTSETNSEEVRATQGRRTMITKQSSEFTIESKTADGFKIVYVMRDISLDGTAPAVPIMRHVSEAMKGIVIRGTIDKSGKPVRIDNLDEARASMRKVIDRLKDLFKEKPQVAAFVDNLLTQMLMVDSAQAAGLYLEQMPQLALGQQTGLKPGEVRRWTDESPSPIGGNLKSLLALQIVRTDAATGNAKLLQTTTYDPASIKQAAGNAARQLLAAAGDKISAAQFDEVVKKMEMRLDGRLEIEVEGGMTRRMHDVTETMATMAGITFTKREVKTVTVTAAP